MRTSRVARDTASVLAATVPRRSSRRIASATSAPAVKRDETPPVVKPEDSPVGKRVTATPQSDQEAELSSRKRKRYPSTSPKTVASSSTAQEPKPRRARRQPAKRVKTEDGAEIVEPPANWRRVYDITTEMRKERPAAVDTMGCEQAADRAASPRDQRFQTLVSLMLSSQTKDPVTAAAMKNLQQNLPGGLNVDAVIAASPATFNALINKVGFHNNKTTFIQRAATICRDEHAGDIPDTIDGLVALPGVGPKMAYLTMSAAWGRDEGIGVDVHVHRITNLWGWHKTATPEATRAALESWLPRDKWHDINLLLVGFGQTWCPPVGRRCGECRLGQQGLCPSAVIDRRRETVRAKREVKIEEDFESVKVESSLEAAKLEPVSPVAKGEGSPARLRQEQFNNHPDQDSDIMQDKEEPANDHMALGQGSSRVKQEPGAQSFKQEIITRPVKQEIITRPIKQEIITRPIKQEIITRPVKQENVAHPVKQEASSPQSHGRVKQEASPLQNNTQVKQEEQAATSPLPRRIKRETPPRRSGRGRVKVELTDTVGNGVVATTRGGAIAYHGPLPDIEDTEVCLG